MAGFTETVGWFYVGLVVWSFAALGITTMTIIHVITVLQQMDIIPPYPCSSSTNPKSNPTAQAQHNKLSRIRTLSDPQSQASPSTTAPTITQTSSGTSPDDGGSHHKNSVANRQTTQNIRSKKTKKIFSSYPALFCTFGAFVCFASNSWVGVFVKWNGIYHGLTQLDCNTMIRLGV